MTLDLTKSQIEQKVVDRDGECPPCVTDVPITILRNSCDEDGKVCQAIDQFARDEITAEQMLAEVYDELEVYRENVKGVREYLEGELR